jgi:peroxiredoxin
VGEAAPPFELTGTDGRIRSLEEELKKGPVLLAFFKVSCPTCHFAFPFLDRLYRQFRARGAAFWGISQDPGEHSRDFGAEYDVTFPILIDDEPYEVSNHYGVEYTPTLFLVGRDGRVELTGDGFSKRDLLGIQKRLGRYLSVAPAELFRPDERVPEFKPG